jgi:hypothetical protein
MPILDAVRSFVEGLKSYWERLGQVPGGDATGFMDEVFRYFPFTAEAQDWLRRNIRLEVLDPYSVTGGGSWYPDQHLVRLHTAQYEAAIHEFSHALWHERRRDRPVRDALVAAVYRLADEGDPRWAGTHTLAHDYVYGIPAQPGFERGMLLPPGEWGAGGGPQGEWNDGEMFAGLASGCMADIRLLPPYVRRFYGDVFQELPPDAPLPEHLAPHH